MNQEELLKMLRDNGLDDEAIKELLTEALAALEPKNPEALEEAEEKNKASELLGIEL